MAKHDGSEAASATTVFRRASHLAADGVTFLAAILQINAAGLAAAGDDDFHRRVARARRIIDRRIAIIRRRAIARPKATSGASSHNIRSSRQSEDAIGAAIIGLKIATR